MPSLTLQLPGKTEPTVISLRGAHITIGRTARNTVQIIDRAVSGSHAELIEEDGHYRLHDVGSTNGTFVNGDQVTDFHLRESCKISFGTVECAFSAEPSASLPPAEENPENAQLASRAAEVQKLQEELAAAHREREQLQRSWDATKEKLAKLREQLASAPAAPRVTPVAAPTAAPSPAPGTPKAVPRLVGARPTAVPGSGVTARPSSPTALPKAVPRPSQGGGTRKLTP